MPLSKNECTVLRGLGILAILLHNYCHWLEGALMENELTFVQERSDAFYAYAVHPDGNAFLQLFSFFGHYGICVFLFLTGYGLTIKYKLQKTEQIAFFPFVWCHYKKLLWLLVGGYVLYQLVIFVGTKSFSGNMFDWVSMLTMTSNFFSLDIWPKPYWYFGLTMQMYLLFYLLVYRTDGNRQVMTILGLMTAVSLMPQFVFSSDSDVVRLLRDNFFIGMLPFTLGVTAALYGKRLKECMKTLYLVIGCTISGLLLFFSNQNLVLWSLAPVFVIVFSLSLVKILPRLLAKPFQWLGAISAALFVIHPTTREICIHKLHFASAPHTELLIFLIFTVIVAYIYHRLWLVKFSPIRN